MVGLSSLAETQSVMAVPWLEVTLVQKRVGEAPSAPRQNAVAEHHPKLAETRGASAWTWMEVAVVRLMGWATAVQQLEWAQRVVAIDL